MPLPFILGLGALAAGAIGIGSALEGVEKMQDAQDELESIERTYNINLKNLDDLQERAVAVLDDLGKTEIEILQSFEEFSNVIGKIQNRPNFKFYDKEGIGLPQYSIEELNKVSVAANAILGGINGAAVGTAAGIAAAGAVTSVVSVFGVASTGTAIMSLSGAAATNATLAALGGGALGSSAFAGGMALGSTVLGAATLGVGLLVGGVVFNAVGSSLSNKVDEARQQLRKMKETIVPIVEYLEELQRIALEYNKSLNIVTDIYMERLKKIKFIVENEKRVDWNDFTEEEQYITENLILLVGLLYRMCKVRLIEKSEEEDGINTINRDEIDKSMSDAESILNVEADRVIGKAKELYDEGAFALGYAQREMAEGLINLAKMKWSVLESEISRFLYTFEKIQFLENDKSVKDWKLSLSSKSIMNVKSILREYKPLFANEDENIVEAAAVLLSVHGYLPIETGNLVDLYATESLESGFSTRALSNGAKCVPLQRIAIPSIDFYEPSLEVSFSENIEMARQCYSMAEKISKQMKEKETYCFAVKELSDELEANLNEIRNVFKECMDILEQMLSDKIKIYKKGLASSYFSWNELEMIDIVCSCAQCTKTYIEEPIFSDRGIMGIDYQKSYELSVDRKFELQKNLEKIKQLKGLIEQENFKIVKSEKSNKWYGISVLVAYVLGIILLINYTEVLMVPMLLTCLWAGFGICIWGIWKLKLVYKKRNRKGKRERGEYLKEYVIEELNEETNEKCWVDEKATKISMHLNKTDRSSVLGVARNIFAIFLGCIVATFLARYFAGIITHEIRAFLFIDSFTANSIACWLLLCTSITISIGRFMYSVVEKLCCYGSGIATSILYVQYCRSVSSMEHYVIFTIIFFLVCIYIFWVFDERKDKWQGASFLSNIALSMVMWTIGFSVYAVFSLWLGLSSSFWLVVTSVVMSILCIVVAIAKEENLAEPMKEELNEKCCMDGMEIYNNEGATIKNPSKEDVKKCMKTMYDDNEEFVVLSLPKAINGVDFIQVYSEENGYAVQVGCVKEDGHTLVEKIYSRQMEVEEIVYKFYKYGIVDNVEQYKQFEEFPV